MEERIVDPAEVGLHPGGHIDVEEELPQGQLGIHIDAQQLGDADFSGRDAVVVLVLGSIDHIPGRLPISPGDGIAVGTRSAAIVRDVDETPQPPPIVGSVDGPRLPRSNLLVESRCRFGDRLGVDHPHRDRGIDRTADTGGGAVDLDLGQVGCPPVPKAGIDGRLRRPQAGERLVPCTDVVEMNVHHSA